MKKFPDNLPSRIPRLLMQGYTEDGTRYRISWERSKTLGFPYPQEGTCRFERTVKTRISDLVYEEDEVEIDPDEAVSASIVKGLVKLRWEWEWKGLKLSMDLMTSGLLLFEIEYPSENITEDFPFEESEVMAEVTSRPQFKNAALAGPVPTTEELRASDTTWELWLLKTSERWAQFTT